MKRLCKMFDTNTDEQKASSIRPLKINFVRMKNLKPNTKSNGSTVRWTALLSLIIILFMDVSTLLAQANHGEIKGRVFDDLGDPMPGASAYVEYMGNKIGTATDMDGRFTIKPLQPGNYNLIISFTGMQTKEIKAVQVKPGQITFVNEVELAMASEIIGIVDIVEYRTKLINPEETSKMTLLATQIEKTPSFRNPEKLLGSITSDVKVSEDGRQVHFRGARNGSSLYFVDGVKTEDMKVPASGIASISVYSGGIPAKYGDTTGGVVIIETKNYFDLYNEAVNNKLNRD
jgi:hypothetical protein